MLIPIGVDEARVSRLPWVSIAIVALNVLVFFGMAASGGGEGLDERLDEIVQYWQERPYLELPPGMEKRLGITREQLAAYTQTALTDAAPPGAAADQAELDRMWLAAVAALDATPERRWSLVPARGLAQPGWITHGFLHGGFGHLLGNMLVLALVVAPFLEDAWGRPFFLAFYLAGVVVAGAAQALPMGDSQIHVLGASGAISACLGAFALRFAHRRVRMFYWFMLFARGTFFVPAWAYAFFGLAMDLLGLKLNGTGGGVAYGAHVGGFLFGVAVAVAVRATGLDARLAPEGAARWGRTLAASRAADALADGRSGEARAHLEDAVARDADDDDSALELARLHARGFDRAAVTPIVERLLARRLSAGDVSGARAVVAELGASVDHAAFRPAVAYRAAELLDGSDPALADRFDEVAATGGGALAAKALLRSARRARAQDPGRAHDLACRARDAEDAPADLRRTAGALADACAPAPAAPSPGPEGAAGLAPDDAVQLVPCRLLGATEGGLELVTAAGRRAILSHERVAALAAALVGPGGAARPALLLDILVRPRPGERGRVVVRLRGNEMALATIHPGVAPQVAYGRVVDALVAASGAPASPSADAAAGRPFARYAGVEEFEEAAWGRRIAG